MFKHGYVLCEAENDKGGGGGSTDRGDVLSTEDVDKALAEKATADAAAKELADADGKAASDLVDKAAADKEAADKEAADKTAADKDAADKEAADKERDANGRFAKKEGKGVIPLDRHEAVLAKERAAREKAEGEAAELKKQIAQVDRTADREKIDSEIEELEKAHAKALVDGKDDEAAATMKAIRLKGRELSIADNNTMNAQMKEQMREEIRLDMVIDNLETKYPELNNEHEGFDETLLEMVLALQRHKMNTLRVPGSQALLDATTEVMGRFGKKTAETSGLTDEEKSEAAAKAKTLASAKIEEDRKKTQVAKNLDAANKQPASMKESGKDSDKAGETKIDVNNLSAVEFAALPEATKSRLRGDTV